MFRTTGNHRKPPTLPFVEPARASKANDRRSYMHRKGYEYAKLQNNEVLLIDPKDRQVAEIITHESTTGRAK
jgi:hypothetical protein